MLHSVAMVLYIRITKHMYASCTPITRAKDNHSLFSIIVKSGPPCAIVGDNNIIVMLP